MDGAMLSFDGGKTFYTCNDIIYLKEAHELIHNNFNDLYEHMERKARKYATMMLHGVDDEYWFIVWYLKTAIHDLIIGGNNK